ncbi:tetratricopeptide repeat-containing sensor histidine kinase [Terrimonas alba]|uniref:tetratricopeptide repeat-containing sensor histidine kinase n=1 Tax=Terrimonas alba TaxID=3349636 RepID=UPI0035F386C7
MLKLFFISSLLCLMIRSHAQLKTDQPPSVLTSALQKNIPDSTRLQLLLQLSLYYYFQYDDSRISVDTVLILLEQANEISDNIRSVKWKPEIFCFLGKCYYRAGDTARAHKYFMKTSDYINNSGSVNNQIERWRELGWNIEELDTIGLTRINCLEKILSLYGQMNNKEKQAETQRHIADTHMKQGKLDLAENELFEVLAKYKAGGYQDIHYLYNLLSVTNHLEGNYNKALNYSLLTIENMKITDDTWAIIFYSHVANLYDELGQPEKSNDYHRIVFKINHPNPVDFYYTREAGLFVRNLIKEKKVGEAHKFLLDFSKKHPPGDPYGKASLARTFAYYYNSVHDYSMADKYNREMISLEPLLGKNNEIRRDVEYDIGQYYFGKKQFAKAALHFGIALDEAHLNNSVNTIKEISLMLFKTDSSLGNYVSAIKHLNQYHQLNDSIFNVAKVRQIREVQVKYETEKKEQNIKLLEKESKIQQSELSQATVTRNWIIGGTGLLLVILVLLLRNIRLKQRTNKKLEAHQIEIDEQNFSLQHLLNEKEWLLKEIHHRVKNNLQIVMSLLNSQSMYIDNDAALTAIHDSQHRVHAMSLIHQKLYSTENVSSIDMSSYIRELVSYLKNSFDTAQLIHFELEIEQVKMDVSQAVPLGLILNEAITNSIKYAFPDGRNGVISISLSNTSADQYLLSISDNGIGMHADCKKTGSLGMSLMKGLSEDLNGTFSIENNNGTEIKISFVHDAEIRKHDVLTTSFVSNN